MPYQDWRRTRHEYVLTEAGADTFPIITALAQWGERHRPHADPGIRMDIVHRSCGHPSTTAEFCSHCGQRLTVEATSWRQSWRDAQDSSWPVPPPEPAQDHPDPVPDRWLTRRAASRSCYGHVALDGDSVRSDDR